MIRVAVADDHPVVRKGLVRTLEREDDVKVVGEADSGDGLVALLEKTPVDVAVLDISTPGTAFLDTLRRLAERHPKLKTVVFSVHEEDHYGPQALRAGAAGYVMKDRPMEDVVKAVRSVFGGAKYASPAVQEKATSSRPRKLSPEIGSPHETLSSREFDVMRCLGDGQVIKDIAKTLGVSTKTVSTFRARVLKKMGFKSNADIVRYMLERKMLS